MSEAVYVVEFRSISHGIGVLDRMLKRSSLVLLHANPICIGKYLIAVGGDVADAKEAKKAAEEPDGQAPMASYLLTGTHPAILEYFRHRKTPVTGQPNAIGIFETRNAASGFTSLDAALKSGQVELMRLWLGQFLGGKFCYVLGGMVSDIQAAMNAAAAVIEEKEHVGTQVIPSPDKTTMSLFTGNTGNL